MAVCAIFVLGKEVHSLHDSVADHHPCVLVPSVSVMISEQTVPFRALIGYHSFRDTMILVIYDIPYMIAMKAGV